LKASFGKAEEGWLHIYFVDLKETSDGMFGESLASEYRAVKSFASLNYNLCISLRKLSPKFV